MIIDDDKDITNLFSIFLEYNGYIVNAYNNPVEAFNNFRKNSHDLIVLDLKMPKMDGMTLYHKIKEIDSNVIICFTTADLTYIEDLRKGIIDIDKIVLYKPVLLKDLKNKIYWLLSRHEEINSNKPTTMMILWNKSLIVAILNPLHLINNKINEFANILETRLNEINNKIEKLEK